MGFVVCTINMKLVMESVSRKAPTLDKSVSVPWPFSMGGMNDGEKDTRDEE